MGFFFDQIANTTGLVAADVVESLNKFHFTSDGLYTKSKEDPPVQSIWQW